jgi:hypothetical protein
LVIREDIDRDGEPISKFRVFQLKKDGSFEISTSEHTREKPGATLDRTPEELAMDLQKLKSEIIKQIASDEESRALGILTVTEAEAQGAINVLHELLGERKRQKTT